MYTERPTDEQLKKEFLELDDNDDGMLDFGELQGLLKRGHPHFSDHQIEVLWNAIDKDGNGKVDFDEFIDFIFSPPPAANPEPLTIEKFDWAPVERTFNEYAGWFQEAGDDRLDLKELLKLCNDIGLFDDDFTQEDCAKVFKKCKKKKEKSMSYQQFHKFVKLAAKRKKMSQVMLANFIAESAGPVIFYDGSRQVKPDPVEGYDLSFLDSLGDF